jgi:hypothetical protein
VKRPSLKTGLLFKPGDLFIAAGLLLLFLIPMFHGTAHKGPGGTVVVHEASGRSFAYPLDVNRTIRFPGPLGESVVRITNESVQMLSSPCRNKLCVKQGAIRNNGESIICVPNRIGIVITSPDSSPAGRTGFNGVAR